MEVLDVRQQIRDKNIDNFYIFMGEENAVQLAYVKKLAEVGNCQIKRIDSVSEIYGKKRGGLFKARECYVAINDTDLIKHESAWDNLLDMVGNNMLILQFTELDKRSKFYSRYKDIIVDFKYLPENILLKYVRRETALSVPYAKKLIEICENSYSRLLLEMDKIKHYASAVDISHDEALKILVEKDAIYTPARDRVFDFVDAVVSGRIADAFGLLTECERSNEPTLIMITLLYQQIRKLLQVQGCNSDDIGKTTGLSDWDIKTVKKYCNVYTNGELVGALKLLGEVERGIKKGLIEEQICMDYLLINILGCWE